MKTTEIFNNCKTLTKHQQETIKDNLRSYLANFGYIKIETDGYRFYVYTDKRGIEKKMEKIKVIFRKFINPYTNKYEIEAFFPELPANYGNILCYAHIGQHSEASYEYYKSTQTANPKEYAELLEELKNIYNDVKIVVKQRIYYCDLLKAWNG